MMKINCRLIRLTDNNHTRTGEMVGWAIEEPRMGHRFTIINEEPLVKEGNDHRMIQTSPVRQIELAGPRLLRFWTENTEYLYEVLP